MTGAAARRSAIRRGLALEWFSIAWMLAEGGVSVGAGVAAGNLSLKAFGFDSLVELISAWVVLWRLRLEARSLADGGAEPGRGHPGTRSSSAATVARAERLASRIVAGCLFAIALYILAGVIQSVRGRTVVRVDEAAVLAGTFWGYAVAWSAVIVMPPLWAAKTRLGRTLGSGALHEDGVGNLACGGMALLVLAGLTMQRLGIWWADPAAALAIGYLVIREGLEAWGDAGSGGHDDHGHGEAAAPERGGGPRRQPVRAYLGLGSNMGDRPRMLASAVELLAGPDLRVVRRSRVYETPPWGKTDQPPFLNQVIEVNTALGPEALLGRCLQVEQRLGRVRAERWGPRTIDVDLLLYGDVVARRPDLTVPHPEMRRRAFVLVPLAEIAPGLRLPTGEAVEALLQGLPDRDAVRALA